MGRQGMDPEQPRAIDEHPRQLSGGLGRVAEEAYRAVERRVRARAEEECKQDIDQEVGNFASALDNMTDARIWRELLDDLLTEEE
jgi:hypothetical protein